MNFVKFAGAAFPILKIVFRAAKAASFQGPERYNRSVKLHGTSWFILQAPKRALACWVDFLVCPRRFLAVLPSHARANLFAGD